MSYPEALAWIMSFWEGPRARAEEVALRPLKVPRMRALLDRLGSPHLKYPSVLVAGTKGKGSTVAFIAEALRAAGYRVGRYTQPHLLDWRERTWVDGQMIEPDEVVELVRRIKPTVEALHQGMRDLAGITTYEAGTALTLSYFADRQVDVAVLEIGVGGRLDAVNAVDPVLSVVTSISLDHTDVLGTTLAEIATEKAGIFREGGVAVSSPQQPEAEAALRRVALEKGTWLYVVGRGGGKAQGARHKAQGDGATGRRGDGETTDAENARRAGACPPPPDGPHPDPPPLGEGDRPHPDPLPGGEGIGKSSPPGRGSGEGERTDTRRAAWWWGPGLGPDMIDVHGQFGSIEGLRVPLLGDHQRDNATVAVAALQLLGQRGFRVDADALRRGVAGVEWPGRVQQLRANPGVIVDAAHNADSVERLLETVRARFRYAKLILVFGASADKDVAGMARVLGPAADQVIATSSGHRRAAEAEAVAAVFAPYCAARAVPDPDEAFGVALSSASPDDLVLVTGSVFLAGRAIQAFSVAGG